MADLQFQNPTSAPKSSAHLAELSKPAASMLKPIPQNFMTWCLSLTGLEEDIIKTQEQHHYSDAS